MKQDFLNVSGSAEQNIFIPFLMKEMFLPSHPNQINQNMERLQFIHPDFDRISEEEKSFLHTGKIIPFYRIPKELKSGNIGDLSLRRIISLAVENYVDKVEETLPEEIIKGNTS